MRRVLMVAFHFPPLAESSGIQRTLRFAQHLPALGWEVAVLTAHPRAYERTSSDLMAEIPQEVTVTRAFALDTARHLAVAGRYPGRLACPDRFVAWGLGAAFSGMRVIRRFRPHVLWSTYPVATAHVIGANLHRRSSLPWVADFRDPMAQEGYPADPRVWSRFRRIEEDTLGEARFSVFTTPGAARVYRERYPRFASRIRVVPNGYDEASFAGLDGAPRAPLNPGAVTVLHSGLVYPSERDPTSLFEALGGLAREGVLVPGRFKLRFRAAGHDDLLRTLTARNDLAPFVETLPAIAYRDALAEMVRADALLVLQASNCNEQVPAKLYEYLRARRPILACTDPAGDTAATLREAGLASIARLDSPGEIAALLRELVRAPASGGLPLPSERYVAGLARGEQARALSGLLEQAVAGP